MKNQRAKDAQRRMASPLTLKQRSYLGILARNAFKKLMSAHALDDDMNEKEWRHTEAIEACGHTISEAPKSAFDALELRFLTLAGQTKQAFDKATQPGNDLRQLTHNIAVAAKACGVGEAYVQGICKRMFGRPDWQGPREGQAVLIALKQKARRPLRGNDETRMMNGEALAAAGVV